MGLSRLPFFIAHGISPLTIAIVLGICVGNSIPERFVANDAGITFAKQWLLRAGIVFYGFRLTFHDIAAVGAPAIVIDAITLTSTFSLAMLARRWIRGIDLETAVLVGAGSAICGAAAVVATAPIIRGNTAHTAAAVSSVVVFGTISMLLYPVLYPYAHQLLNLSPSAYGVFVGSTIHEVAQVVAAGHAAGPVAADTAVITKMVRVMMLAPFLVLLSTYVSKSAPAATDKHASSPGRTRAIPLPWFALGFIAVAAFNSVLQPPPALASSIASADNLILATAMAALGLATRLVDLVKTSARAFALGAILFTWLVLGGIMINSLVWHLAGK